MMASGRPVEGLLEKAEVDELCRTMEQFGGRFVRRQPAVAKPYEINIAARRAQGTTRAANVARRFLCAPPSCWGSRVFRFISTPCWVPT